MKKYISVSEASIKWNVSERSVRNYCVNGKIVGAFFEGKSWKIPSKANKPIRKKRISKISHNLLIRLKQEKESKLSGGIYHRVQVELTYNSNHIEGSKLTYDQTRFIFETHTVGLDKKVINVDDIIETTNHFRCIDLVIEHANYKLTESFIKQLHFILKTGTFDSNNSWFAVGDYKKLENEVGGLETTKPESVSKEMKKLITKYNQKSNKTLKDILEFHYQFERIHPFQDGNGRVGRLIIFKECLKYNITPFIIEDDLKEYYYRGLKEWKNNSEFLTDTCLLAQDRFKTYLDYFEIEYVD